MLCIQNSNGVDKAALTFINLDSKNKTPKLLLVLVQMTYFSHETVFLRKTQMRLTPKYIACTTLLTCSQTGQSTSVLQITWKHPNFHSISKMLSYLQTIINTAHLRSLNEVSETRSGKKGTIKIIFSSLHIYNNVSKTVFSCEYFLC